MTALRDYLPPQALDMEQAVLGAMLVDPACLETPDAPRLSPADFYREHHRAIYEAITALRVAGEPVDLLTVRQTLANRGLLETCGGGVYLATLIDAIPATALAPHYARQVAESATRRRMLGAASQISALAQDGETPLPDALNRAEAALKAACDTLEATAGPQTVGELADGHDTVMQARHNRKGLQGYPTGIEGLNRLTGGLQAQGLYTLAGRSGMGKTSLSLTLALAAAAQTGVYYVSLEMPAEQIFNRLIAQVGGVCLTDLQQGYFPLRSEYERYQQALNYLRRTPLVIDERPALTITEIHRTLRRLGGVGLLVVDQLSHIGREQKFETERLHYVDAARRLKDLAKRERIAVLALLQCNRNTESRQDHRPTAGDLAESDAPFHESDVVLAVHRPQSYRRGEGGSGPVVEDAEIVCLKNRHGASGTLQVGWDNRTAEYRDTSDAPGRWLVDPFCEEGEV